MEFQKNMAEITDSLLPRPVTLEVMHGKAKLFKPMVGEPSQVTLQLPGDESTTNVVLQIVEDESDEHDHTSLFKSTFKEKQEYLFMIWGATSVLLGFLHSHVDEHDFKVMMVLLAVSVAVSFLIWLALFEFHEGSQDQDPCEKVWLRVFLQVCYSFGLLELGISFVANFLPKDWHMLLACSLFGLLGLVIGFKEWIVYRGEKATAGVNVEGETALVKVNEGEESVVI